MKDSGGQPIPAQPSDTIKVTFRDYNGNTVHEFTATGSASITLNVTQEISNKFPEGVYAILVKFNGEYVTTLLKNNKVVVE